MSSATFTRSDGTSHSPKVVIPRAWRAILAGGCEFRAAMWETFLEPNAGETSASALNLGPVRELSAAMHAERLGGALRVLGMVRTALFAGQHVARLLTPELCEIMFE